MNLFMFRKSKRRNGGNDAKTEIIISIVIGLGGNSSVIFLCA